MNAGSTPLSLLLQDAVCSATEREQALEMLDREGYKVLDDFHLAVVQELDGFGSLPTALRKVIASFQLERRARPVRALCAR